MRCSKDLRRRVIAFVESGGKKIEAARRFGVGISSVHRWMVVGEIAQKPGPKGPHKIVVDNLHRILSERPDSILRELGAELKVHPSAVCRAMKKLKITRKKNVEV